MITDKSIYQIALTQIKGVGISHARALMEAVGDEEAIFRGDIRLLESIPRISQRLIREIRNPEVLRRADQELRFVEKNSLRLLFYTDPDYPQRLTQCIDAPLLLYARGNTDFNHARTISIVGTRNSTRYGEEFCREFVAQLAKKTPGLQIISGLAYGIDICAHRESLRHEISTVAVLAHGLDRIYPYVHRQTAIDMLRNGAVLTEFPSGTNPDRHNFVKRNRIVAGMADAVIVMESGEKGGSLTTADMANSYFREVFALPGRVSDRMSSGCNRLIAENNAILLRDMDSFLTHMGWDEKETKKETPKQTELFDDLTEEEQKIIHNLEENGPMHVNTLSIELDIPVSELFMILLELEVKNRVISLPGGMYRLI